MQSNIVFMTLLRGKDMKVCSKRVLRHSLMALYHFNLADTHAPTRQGQSYLTQASIDKLNSLAHPM
jgi:hypothetical protein